MRAWFCPNCNTRFPSAGTLDAHRKAVRAGTITCRYRPGHPAAITATQTVAPAEEPA